MYLSSFISFLPSHFLSYLFLGYLLTPFAVAFFCLFLFCFIYYFSFFFHLSLPLFIPHFCSFPHRYHNKRSYCIPPYCFLCITMPYLLGYSSFDFFLLGDLIIVFMNYFFQGAGNITIFASCVCLCSRPSIPIIPSFSTKKEIAILL